MPEGVANPMEMQNPSSSATSASITMWAAFGRPPLCVHIVMEAEIVDEPGFCICIGFATPSAMLRIPRKLQSRGGSWDSVRTPGRILWNFAKYNFRGVPG